jgi:hypothetical protein
VGTVQNFVQIIGLNPYVWCFPTVVAEREAGCFFPICPEVQDFKPIKVVSNDSESTVEINQG